MIINFAINTNSFVYCSVYESPSETTNYYNVGNGHFHQHIYIVEGKAEYTISDTKDPAPDAVYLPLEGKNYYNLSHCKGKYVITKTDSNSGMAMMMFNPIPDDKSIDVEIIQSDEDNKKVLIEAGDKRVTVVCITGPVNIKGKQIDSMQYAVVFTNKTAELVMNKNTVCAIVTG